MKALFSYLKSGFSREMPADQISSEQNTRKNLKRLFWFLKPHFPKIAAGVLLSLLLALLDSPRPLISKYLIDDVILGKKYGWFPILVAIVVVTKLVEKGVNIILAFYLPRFENKVIVTLQQNLIERVLNFPKSFFDEKDVGYLMARVYSDAQGLRWFFSGAMRDFTANFFRLIIGVALLFYLQPALALITLFILPCAVVFTKYFSRRFRVLSHHSAEQGAELSREMHETLSLMPLVKAFAREKKESKKLVQRIKDLYEITMEQTALSVFMTLGSGSFLEFSNFLVLLIGVPMIFQGQWTLGSMTAFSAYLASVIGPMQSLSTMNASMQEAFTSLDRYFAFYNILPEEKNGGRQVERLNGDIEFKNVSFSYDGKTNVLDRISFKVPHGERLVIVGPSGVGKTTLTSLILGFYKPSDGDILFDGVPLSQYSIESLRRRIGYVSQKIYLASGSILENLQYGNPDAGLDEVMRAAKAAGIHDFIQGLPGAYHSILGENGVNISQGQAQRLSIARALVKDPDILIFDEPTSSIDVLVERSIFDSLPEVVRNKTLIVVTHHLSTLRDSSRVLVLGGSRIEAIGTHRELMEKSDFYRAMIDCSATEAVKN